MDMVGLIVFHLPSRLRLWVARKIGKPMAGGGWMIGTTVAIYDPSVED